jgi:hypothetical protein
MNEFAKWVPSMGVVLYDGGMEERKAIRAEHLDKPAFNVLVTHYDLIIRDKNVLKKVSHLSFLPSVLSRLLLVSALHPQQCSWCLSFTMIRASCLPLLASCTRCCADRPLAAPQHAAQSIFWCSQQNICVAFGAGS